MNANIRRQGRATVVELIVTVGALSEEKIIAVGRAVCAKEDHYVSKVGERIALARALQDFGRQLEERWEPRVITKAQLAERKQAKESRKAKTTSQQQLARKRRGPTEIAL